MKININQVSLVRVQPKVLRVFSFVAQMVEHWSEASSHTTCPPLNSRTGDRSLTQPFLGAPELAGIGGSNPQLTDFCHNLSSMFKCGRTGLGSLTRRCDAFQTNLSSRVNCGPDSEG